MIRSANGEQGSTADRWTAPSTTVPAHGLFDAHLHIIDPRFPLRANQGYLPKQFTCHDYLERVQRWNVRGGAVVSGSFQGDDQDYLRAALKQLGPTFAGVTQLPARVTDSEIIDLDAAGVRGVRFNLRRGGMHGIQHLDTLARRVHELAGWHAELYVDAGELPGLFRTLVALPALSIEHLGLSRRGLATLLRLAERGVRVKATGFGRVDFDVPGALCDLYAAHPGALMFGTDLPSTRAPRPFAAEDISIIVDTLGADRARRVLYQNAVDFYRPGMGVQAQG